MVAQGMEPLVIGQSVMNNRSGKTWIGITIPLWMTNEMAMSTEFEVLSEDAPFLLRARPSYCDNYYPLVINCYIEVPVMIDSYNVKARYGNAPWSNIWSEGMIPCGYFIGEQVFPNSTEVNLWAGRLGQKCVEDEVISTIPTPTNLRIKE